MISNNFLLLKKKNEEHKNIEAEDISLKQMRVQLNGAIAQRGVNRTRDCPLRQLNNIIIPIMNVDLFLLKY